MPFYLYIYFCFLLYTSLDLLFQKLPLNIKCISVELQKQGNVLSTTHPFVFLYSTWIHRWNKLALCTYTYTCVRPCRLRIFICCAALTTQLIWHSTEISDLLLIIWRRRFSVNFENWNWIVFSFDGEKIMTIYDILAQLQSFLLIFNTGMCKNNENSITWMSVYS